MSDAIKQMEKSEKKNLKPLEASQKASPDQAPALQEITPAATSHPSASPAAPKKEDGASDKQQQKEAALKKAVILSTLYKVAGCGMKHSPAKKKAAALTKKAEQIVKKAELQVAIRKFGVDAVIGAVQRAVKN